MARERIHRIVGVAPVILSLMAFTLVVAAVSFG
jgi:hypothetical protein